jgi:hypothetical protein
MFITSYANRWLRLGILRSSLRWWVSLKSTLKGMHSICTISLLPMTSNSHFLKKDDNSCNKAIVIKAILHFLLLIVLYSRSVFHVSSSTMFVVVPSMLKGQLMLQYFCIGRFIDVLIWLFSTLVNGWSLTNFLNVCTIKGF